MATSAKLFTHKRVASGQNKSRFLAKASRATTCRCLRPRAARSSAPSVRAAGFAGPGEKGDRECIFRFHNAFFFRMTRTNREECTIFLSGGTDKMWQHTCQMKRWCVYRPQKSILSGMIRSNADDFGALCSRAIDRARIIQHHIFKIPAKL